MASNVLKVLFGPVVSQLFILEVILFYIEVTLKLAELPVVFSKTVSTENTDTLIFLTSYNCTFIFSAQWEQWKNSKCQPNFWNVCVFFFQH